jgi:cytochrome c-type biogenesis protein CcmH
MLMVVLRRLALALCLMGLAAPAWSVAVDPPLDDPVLEARAREIHKQLRCLVCQNQSIEDSNATLARDLRMLVRERITAGDSDEAAIRFIVARYGDWVLLRPPMKGGTLLLWFGPALLLVLVVISLAVAYRRRSRRVVGTIAPLSAEERALLDDLLDNRDPT